MNYFQVLKEQAEYIDRELVNITNTTNSFFETTPTTKTPITELENYLEDLKKFSNDVQVELDLQRKNLRESKKQVKNVTETLNKLDDLISNYDNDNSSISNANQRLSNSTSEEILEKEITENTLSDINEELNDVKSVNIQDLLNKPLPEL